LKKKQQNGEKNLRLLWADQAKNSLKKISSHIAERSSEAQAAKVRTAILKSASDLLNFPKKFQKEPFLEDEQGEYRYAVIYSYKIIYEITANEIIVYDVFHTSRNPEEIKKIRKI
jgi:plasmid stabilization system protein ParE